MESSYENHIFYPHAIAKNAEPAVLSGCLVFRGDTGRREPVNRMLWASTQSDGLQVPQDSLLIPSILSGKTMAEAGERRMQVRMMGRKAACNRCTKEGENVV